MSTTAAEKTKRGLFYFRTHLDDAGNMGVINKCLDIVEAFEEYGVVCDHYFFNEKGLIKNQKEQFSLPFPTPKNSFGHWRLFWSAGGRKLMQHCDFGQYDFIYIRHIITTPIFIQRLKVLKKQYPNLKILLEIPTYPYDAEVKSWTDRALNLMDRWYRRQLKGLIDLILLDVPQSKVFGVPALFIPIGISKKKILQNTETLIKNRHHTELIFIGNISFWHGLDRVLLGLKQYKKQGHQMQRPVFFRIIGSGLERPRLKKMVLANGISEMVEFHSPMPYEALKEFLKSAHIGIGTLGAHRKQLTDCSSIKHRDYFGMGLPFVYSGNDPDFTEVSTLTHRCAEDDSALVVSEILNWYDTIASNPSFAKAILHFTEKNLLWSKQIKPLVEFIYGSKFAGNTENT